MLVTELETFVQKFHQLWNDGHVAHLDVDTCAGKAWVGLRVHLGQVPGPLHHCQPHPTFKNRKKVDSPSRQRRCAARAAARASPDNVEEAFEPVRVEEYVETEDVEQTICDKDTTATVVSVDVDDKVNENDDKLLNTSDVIEVGNDLHENIDLV